MIPALWARAEGRAELLDDRGHQRRRQLARAVDELRQRLALGPLERQVVQSVRGAVVVGLDDVGMLDPGAVLGLAQEALDGDRVLRQPRPQDLHRGPAALGVLGAIDRGRAALADVLGEVVARHRASDHVVGVHGSAKLP